VFCIEASDWRGTAATGTTDLDVRPGWRGGGGLRWSLRSESGERSLLLGHERRDGDVELSLLRQRSLEAIRQKARRGELAVFIFPWPLLERNGKMEMDPDRRIQTA